MGIFICDCVCVCVWTLVFAELIFKVEKSFFVRKNIPRCVKILIMISLAGSAKRDIFKFFDLV